MEATNRLARMVVGSEEYIAQLEEVKKYSNALAEHRQRIKEVASENIAAAGSVNALSEEQQVAVRTLNNLDTASAEYEIQLKKVQDLEARLGEIRQKQQSQNIAVAGSVRALEEELLREKKILHDLVIGTKEYQEQLRKVQSLDGDLQKHQQSLKGVGQGWSLLKGGVDNFIGLAAGAFAVDTVIGYGKQLYNTGVQMDALDKKARTVFGETLPKVTSEAQANASAMGLTNAQYVAAAANIQDLLVPMGFQRDKAADISTQLVNLSGALSEWTGGQRSASEVSEILNKALLGEREELKGLGISISEADVSAKLAEKGLSKLTGTALEQAKAMSTLELILAKSTDAQTQFANGTDSAVRRQAELAAKIKTISENLSRLLLPVFESLAAGLSSFVDGISGAVEGIESLVQPAKSATKAFDEQSQKVGDLQKNILPLLSRYDELTGKTTLTKDEQDELQKIITTVADVIPTAISGFNKYGEALGLNTTKAREFIEVERARLKFINQEAIKENEKFIAETQRQADVALAKLNSGTAAKTSFSTTGFGATTEFKSLTSEEIKTIQSETARLQETLKGANAELARLRGDTLKIPEPPKPNGGGTGSGGNGDGGGGGTGKDSAAKKTEQEQKSLTDLLERTTELRREFLAKQSNDEIELAIQSIEKKYDAEISKAIELEQKGYEAATEQRKILELSKQEEIALVTREIAEKAREEQDAQLAEALQKEQEKSDAIRKIKEEEFQKDNEQRLLQEEQRLKFEEELKTFTNEGLLTEREAAIQALEEHYRDLLAIAEQYGYDTTALKESFAAQQADLEKEYADKALKEQSDAQKARLEALQSTFSAFGDFITSTFDLIGGEGEKAAAFQKVATLAKIAFDTASAISSLTAFSEANYGNAFTFGAAGVAQFIAGIARITANIAQAKKILNSAPQVKQKYQGRYLNVTGEDDQRTYNAAVIAPPDTGLLPNHPVLFQSNATGAPVLASERGREYFVSSESLRNPYIANLTRMIDNITISGGRGVPQFAEGGVNQSSPTPAPISAAAPAAIPDMIGLIAQNTSVMQALLNAINSGIVAVIPDRTITEIPARFGKINDASGGFYG